VRDKKSRIKRIEKKAKIIKKSYIILNAFLKTKKGVVKSAKKNFFFSVRKTANKIQIKKAVEDVYKVKVLSVNTLMMNGKQKRVRTQVGKTPDWKKAVVTLKDGQKIDLA
jgi:large subunit ribosomal protein L23